MATDPPVVPDVSPLALVVQMQNALDALRKQVTNPRSPLDAADRAVIASKIPDIAEGLSSLYRAVTRSNEKRTEATHARLI